MERKTHSLSVIYKELLPLLFRYGSKFTGNSEIVEDSVHDLFEKLCKKEDLSNIHNIKYYLLRSFKNILLDNLARRIPTDNIDEVSHNHLQEKSAEDHFIEAEEIQQFNANIEKTLECLSRRQKELIYLYFIEQRSYDEICQMLGINYRTAQNTMHRALTTLRKKLRNKKHRN